MAVAYPYSKVMAPRQSVRHNAVIDGVDTSWWVYDSAPDAKTIVMVHGFRGDHHGLELFADALPEYRVIIPDLPGFGESGSWETEVSADGYGRWLTSFLDHTKSTNAPVLGHSFGTIVVSNGLRGPRSAPIILVNPISQRALTGPNRLMTAVASSWYRVGALLPERAGNALLSFPLSVRVMSELLAKSRDSGLRAWIHNQHALYFSSYSDLRSLVGAYTVSISHDVSEYAASVAAPVLLVVADRDEITPLSAQERVRNVFPNAELTVLSGVGHLVHYEKPLETAAAVRKFLARH
jgi:pimeloyl-ACP methyl ester carboxylesterase